MLRKLYRFLLECYFMVRPLRIRELFVGTKAWEDYWAKKSKGKSWHIKAYDWVEASWESKDHPHRQLLIDGISKFRPKSILEIGCASGANLFLVAKKYPKAQIWGIDINKKAVDYGNRQFKQLGMGNVRLAVGKAGSLLFAENAFDVVFTDAMLIYVGPDKIKQVIEQMLNIAKKGLVLVEWHRSHTNGLGVYSNGLWQRNYKRLLGRHIPRNRITVARIPKEVWSAWNGRGTVIEVRL